MSAPIPFPLHERLQRVLGITATFWGLGAQQRSAPKSGFAISY
jgi:hypothetical protein